MDLRSEFLSEVVRGRMSFRRREGVVSSFPVGGVSRLPIPVGFGR